MLIAKAHDALPPGGAFIVFEASVDDDRRPLRGRAVAGPRVGGPLHFPPPVRK
jgi:hypothetical protein